MRSKKPDRHDIHVFVPGDLYRQLKEQAEADHRTLTSLVAKILADWNKQQDMLAKSGVAKHG